MIQYVNFAVVLYSASILQFGDGYRILGVFPSPYISHQLVFRGLTLALNERGHELVVVTTDPVNDPTLTNYTEIDISFGYDIWGNLDFIEHRGKTRRIDRLPKILNNYLDLIDRILSQPDLRSLYAPDSNEKFDLVLVEMICWQSIFPLATRFSVPMIGITSLALNLEINYDIGNPIFSHHMANWDLETKLSDSPSFWHRLESFFTIWKYMYWHKTTYVPAQQAIARKYFGNDVPNLSDLAKNVSLLLVNQQRAISYARPNVPKVIEIGGFQNSKESTSMSTELGEILDGSSMGFVYMSLGTTVKSELMPTEMKEKFVTAFSRLPYKVLWKLEDDVLPGKPENVYITKWVPQQAVLAHPNLKAFIYQGGVQSTEEAVHNAVPLVGFPIAFDQDMQVEKMVSLGVAKKLEIRTFHADDLFEAISTVASDVNYKQRMLNLRSLMKDTPHDPLENAMWWIEHVTHHRGAPHLHSTTADEPWYSRQDMDIVAFISAGFVVVMGLILVILVKLVECILKFCTSRSIYAKKMN